MLRPWFLVGLLVLAAPPINAASQLSAQLAVTGDAVFVGQSQLNLTWVGSVMDSRLGPVQGFGFRFEGSIRQINYTFAQLARERDSPTGYGHDTILLSREPWQVGFFDDTFRAAIAGPNATFTILPEEPLIVSESGPFVLTPRQDLQGILDRTRPGPDASSDLPPRPAGSLVRELPIDPGLFRGKAVAIGYVMDSATGRLDGAWTDGANDFAGIATAGVATMRVLILDGEFAFEQPFQHPNWAVIASKAEGELTGDLYLQNAQGHGEINGTSLPSEIHTFQAHGPLSIGADYSSPRSSWTVEGQPRFVAVNSIAVLGTRIPTAAGLAAGIGILTVLTAILSKFGRALLSAVAGLHRATPLKHPVRRQLLSLVAAEPGINQLQVAAKMHISRGSTRHHLAILLRSGLLQERSQGSATTYTLNSGSFDFAVPGAGVPAASALTESQNGARRQILDALNACSHADYAGLVAHWHRHGKRILSPSLVTYHCQRLQQAGLISRRTINRHAVWSRTGVEQDLMAHQKRAFVARSGLAPVVALLQEQPQREEDLAKRMAASGAPRNQVHDQVQVLELTGLAYRLPDGRLAAALP